MVKYKEIYKEIRRRYTRKIIQEKIILYTEKQENTRDYLIFPMFLSTLGNAVPSKKSFKKRKQIEKRQYTKSKNLHKEKILFCNLYV